MRNLLLKTLLACAFALSSQVYASAATLIYARGADSANLDPALALSSEDFKISDWFAEGLVRFKKESTDIEPALATSWERSQDGLVWTFHLRKGVKFQDGTDFKADAVKFSFERQFKKDNPFYTPRYARWSGKLNDMTDVEIVDDYTVNLHFSTPQPMLLDNLAIYVAYMLSPTAAKKDPSGLAANPVGTGPFKLVKWQKGEFIELSRFDEYWDGPAKSDRLIVRVIPDTDVRLLALQKGEVQLTDDLPFNRLADIEAARDTRVQTTPAFGYSSLAINMQSDKLKDIRVRQAISYAINRDRVFAISFFKRGAPANQPMPVGVLGHANDKDITIYPYDPERAKKLLAEAGFSSGLKLNFLTFANPRPYFPAPVETSTLIKADLARVGIDAVVTTATWPDWVAKRRGGDYDITLHGQTASTVDPDGVIYPIFHSSQIGIDNTSRYANPEVDKLLNGARQTYDIAERNRLYGEAVKIITAEASTVFLAHPVFTLGYRANVVDALRNPANQVPLHDAVVK